MEITKEDFESYEAIRLSGTTNMFNIAVVIQLSGLDRITVLELMKNYTLYRKLYIYDIENG